MAITSMIPAMPLPDWPQAIFISTVCLLLYVYYALSRPLNRVKPLGALGYGASGTDSRDGRVSQVNVDSMQRTRRVGDTPAAFPNGWYCILESRQLAVGQARSVVVFGEHLLVFRANSGVARITSAYCPHLGVNLGIGGKAVGADCVQCPFHGWVFDAANDGRCVDVPYSKRAPPPAAKLATWHCVERNQHVYVWYHCDNVAPEWEIPQIDEIDSGKWIYSGRLEHQVSCHAQEIPENGSDIAHLNHLHLHSIAFGNDPEKIESNNPEPWFKHLWKADWKPEARQLHAAAMTIHHELTILGVPVPGATLDMVARQIGPGIVYMTFDFGIMGTCATLHHVTPERPLLQRTRYQLWAPSYWPQVMCNVFLVCEAVQYERDIFMWNNKCYVPKPILCGEDAAISKHRRWYKQFYTDNSRTFHTSSADPFGTLDHVGDKLQW